jgi:hypothetical protein
LQDGEREPIVPARLSFFKASARLDSSRMHSVTSLQNG